MDLKLYLTQLPNHLVKVIKRTFLRSAKGRYDSSRKVLEEHDKKLGFGILGMALANWLYLRIFTCTKATTHHRAMLKTI